jgi:hypothetical protein
LDGVLFEKVNQMNALYMGLKILDFISRHVRRRICWVPNFKSEQRQWLTFVPNYSAFRHAWTGSNDGTAMAYSDHKEYWDINMDFASSQCQA